MVFNYVPNFPHPMTIIASSHSSKHTSGNMNIDQCRTTMMHKESEMILFQSMSLDTAKAPTVSPQGFLLAVSASIWIDNAGFGPPARLSLFAVKNMSGSDDALMPVWTGKRAFSSYPCQISTLAFLRPKPHEYYNQWHYVLRHNVYVLLVVVSIHSAPRNSFSIFKEHPQATSDVKIYYMHGPIHQVFVPNSWALTPHMSEICCVRD